MKPRLFISLSMILMSIGFRFITQISYEYGPKFLVGIMLNLLFSTKKTFQMKVY